MKTAGNSKPGSVQREQLISKMSNYSYSLIFRRSFQCSVLTPKVAPSNRAKQNLIGNGIKRLIGKYCKCMYMVSFVITAIMRRCHDLIGLTQTEKKIIHIIIFKVNIN